MATEAELNAQIADELSDAIRATDAYLALPDPAEPEDSTGSPTAYIKIDHLC